MAQKLNTLINHLFAEHHRWKFTLLQNWTSIIGNLHTKVAIEKITKDTLVLGVKDSCWLQELYLFSPMLLDRINQTLDQPYIKKIHFKKQSTSKKRRVKHHYKKPKPDRCHVLNQQEKDVLQSVENVELRTALKQFLMRCYREQEHEDPQNNLIGDNVNYGSYS